MRHWFLTYDRFDVHSAHWTSSRNENHCMDNNFFFSVIKIKKKLIVLKMHLCVVRCTSYNTTLSICIYHCSLPLVQCACVRACMFNVMIERNGSNWCTFIISILRCCFCCFAYAFSFSFILNTFIRNSLAVSVVFVSMSMLMCLFLCTCARVCGRWFFLLYHQFWVIL